MAIPAQYLAPPDSVVIPAARWSLCAIGWRMGCRLPRPSTRLAHSAPIAKLPTCASATPEPGQETGGSSLSAPVRRAQPYDGAAGTSPLTAQAPPRGRLLHSVARAALEKNSAAGIAQIQACAAVARHECFCPCARLGRAIAKATFRVLPGATSTPPRRPVLDQRGRAARGCGAAEIVRKRQRRGGSAKVRTARGLLRNC